MTERTWVERYLSLIGVEEEAPGLDGLGRLVRAHVQGVPFENSASLLRRHEAGAGPVAAIDSRMLLADWEARRAGGVCFEHAEMFGRLLVELGYDVIPIAGEISFPGSHQALVVDLAGARWLVDVGNGAPFFEPIALDRPIEIHRLGLSYRWTGTSRTGGTNGPATPGSRTRSFSSGAARRKYWSSGTWTSTATPRGARSLRGSRIRTDGLAWRDRGGWPRCAGEWALLASWKYIRYSGFTIQTG